jgi:hypothetical protein
MYNFNYGRFPRQKLPLVEILDINIMDSQFVPPFQGPNPNSLSLDYNSHRGDRVFVALPAQLAQAIEPGLALDDLLPL